MSILDLAVDLNKFEIAFMLLLLADTKEELDFVKSAVVNKQFIDMLLRNIRNDLIQ